MLLISSFVFEGEKRVLIVPVPNHRFLYSFAKHKKIKVKEFTSLFLSLSTIPVGHLKKWSRRTKYTRLGD